MTGDARPPGRGIIALAGEDPAAGAAAIKADVAYETLRAQILEGIYPPGARLKEVEIAERLGVSRTPVRDCFRQLELDGIVRLVPHRGAVVRELTEADVEEIFALRAALEGYCASQAATRMDSDGVRALSELQHRMEQSLARARVDADALVSLNAVFHRAVIDGSEMTRTAGVLDKATAIPRSLRGGFWASPRQREAAIVYHREIVDAIRARDPLRADAVMKSHIYAAKDFFVEQLQTESEVVN